MLGSPLAAAEAFELVFVVPLPLLAAFVVECVDVLEGEEEEGGRQKSSNRSARREECMCR